MGNYKMFSGPPAVSPDCEGCWTYYFLAFKNPTDLSKMRSRPKYGVCCEVIAEEGLDMFNGCPCMSCISKFRCRKSCYKFKEYWSNRGKTIARGKTGFVYEDRSGFGWI